MNEIDNDILQKLVGDSQLLGAARRFFLERISANLPKVGVGDNDTLLGQKYRAYDEAKFFVDNCFAELEGLKRIAAEEVDVNRAR